MKRLAIIAGFATLFGALAYFGTRVILWDLFLGEQEENVAAYRPHLLRYLALVSDYLENPQNLEKYDVQSGAAFMTKGVYPQRTNSASPSDPEQPMETTRRLLDKAVFLPRTLGVGELDDAKHPVTYSGIEDLIEERVADINISPELVTPGRLPAGKTLVFDPRSAHRLAQVLYCCRLYFDLDPSGPMEKLAADAELRPIMPMLDATQRFASDVEHNQGPMIQRYSLIAGGVVVLVGLVAGGIFGKRRKRAPPSSQDVKPDSIPATTSADRLDRPSS